MNNEKPERTFDILSGFNYFLRNRNMYIRNCPADNAVISAITKIVATFHISCEEKYQHKNPTTTSRRIPFTSGEFPFFISFAVS